MSPPPDAPPEAADALADALARANLHARRAFAEALEALRALLDAASVASTGAAADAHPLFAEADRWIRRASAGLADGGVLGAELGAALAQALEGEIARWEQRARTDDDARAVLRAFLGVRELLWELGVRPAASAASDSAAPGDAARGEPAAPAATRRRVERVAVRG